MRLEPHVTQTLSGQASNMGPPNEKRRNGQCNTRKNRSVAINWATDSVYNLKCEDGSLLFKIENAFRPTTFSLLKELNSNILQVLHFTEAVIETWRRLIIQSSN